MARPAAGPAGGPQATFPTLSPHGGPWMTPSLGVHHGVPSTPTHSAHSGTGRRSESATPQRALRLPADTRSTLSADRRVQAGSPLSPPRLY